MADPVHIVWFKRDLRIADHRPLAEAARRGPVLPLYVAEPAWLRGPDMAARHWSFIAECLAELQEALGALGQPLVIRVGDVVEVLEEIASRRPVAGLWSHEETGNGWTFERDRRVAAWARATGVPWAEFRQSGVIRRLKSRNGWARRWDDFMAEPVVSPPAALKPADEGDPGAVPVAASLGLAADPCPQRQAGGRRAAMATLSGFLNQRGAPYRKAMSSPLTAYTHCSRLSPYLAWGTVSMRETAQAAWTRQRTLKTADARNGWRGSLKSFSSRLHWRDHFTQKLEDEPRIEFENFHPAYDGLRPKTPDAARFEAWRNGETGLPFVDACMRALTATGWMNFRMRAMLMAVASFHLWLDWRKPGEHLARLFVDYEPGIHWSQAQMQSGATGINTVRIYNPVKQGRDQDPDGIFIKRWAPELEAVPAEYVHEPWRWEGAPDLLGKTYPHPVVDHLEAAREARRKVWGVRGSPAYRETAAAIQERHGSRKSGMRRAGRRKTPPRADGQLSLPLE